MRNKKTTTIFISLSTIIFIFVGLYFTLRSIESQKPQKILNKQSFQELDEFCQYVPLKAEDRRTNKDKLVFVTFNAEWLFYFGGKRKIKCPGENCPWKTEEEAIDHIEKVASYLDTLNADIINIVEIENCKIFGILIDKMTCRGYKPYIGESHDTNLGQNVGFLTRIDPLIPLIHTKQLVKIPVEFSKCEYLKGRKATSNSKHYLTKFKVENFKGKTRTIWLCGTHLIAGPSSRRRCPRREGAAQVLVDLIRKYREPHDGIIIAGDFNDYDHEVEAAWNHRSISNTLGILKSLDLVNAAEFAPVEDRYSNWYDENQNGRDDGDNEHSLIDHILVSRGLKLEKTEFCHSYPVDRNRVSDHWAVKTVIDLS